MKQITSAQLREMFQQFMESKGHHRIPSASVIPENDPTVLFTTAGMHPLVPYLMGTPHPAGTRLTDVQKCIRTGDIDDVGDPSHLTFFEMLGNWSLGDYFKKEMIPWSWEFLTSEKYLGLDPDKLAFTVFEGDEDCPRDEEAANLWRSCGVKDDHLFYLPKEHNWWGPAGITGPCGPDTEMFYWTGPLPAPEVFDPADKRWVEIWNDVFMQYNKQKDGTFIPLKQKNVDTGMGLERTICVLTGKKTVYETDAFTDILAKIAELSGKEYGADEETTKAFRIIADHMRTSTFILGDDRGVSPSNTDQGYILRRLIRRAVRYGMQLGMPDGFTCEIAKVIINQYKNAYPELERNAAFVIDQLTLEEGRFARTLKQGNKEFDKVASRAADGKIDGETAFHLYDTYGFPIEMTVELAKERNLTVDTAGFEEAFRKHQELSHQGAEQKFKGGLADTSEETARLHTATHLLQAALREVLGDHVHQAGSYQDAEITHFDFTHFSAVTPEELARVQKIVNDKIYESMNVTVKEMPIEEAKKLGAMALFGEKYGKVVRVVNIEGWSTEFCGGTHVKNTAQIGGFKIVSESSVAAGIRRIEAVTGRNLLVRANLQEAMLHTVANTLKANNITSLPIRAEAVMAENKAMSKELEEVKAKIAASKVNSLFDNAEEVSGVKIASAYFTGTTGETLRGMCDSIREKAVNPVVAVLVGKAEDKVTMAVTVNKLAQEKGLKAGVLVKEISAIAGGKGGGKPDFAMAGLKDETKIDEALAAVKGIVEKQLG